MAIAPPANYSGRLSSAGKFQTRRPLIKAVTPQVPPLMAFLFCDSLIKFFVSLFTGLVFRHSRRALRRQPEIWDDAEFLGFAPREI